MSKASSKREERSRARAQANKRRTLLVIAGAVIVVGIVALLVFLLPSGGGGGKEISVDEAATKGDQGAFILDVRTPQEWEEYHIAGSTLIPLDELPARVDEVPKDQEVVVVCRSGNRSQEGRDILLGEGFTDVLSMKGGLLDWMGQGYPVVSGP